MIGSRSCDVCKRIRQGKVHRYSLKRHVKVPKLSVVGAGGIDMCDECWEEIGKPRMAPGRAPKRNSFARASSAEPISSPGSAS